MPNTQKLNVLKAFSGLENAVSIKELNSIGILPNLTYLQLERDIRYYQRQGLLKRERQVGKNIYLYTISKKGLDRLEYLQSQEIKSTA